MKVAACQLPDIRDEIDQSLALVHAFAFAAGERGADLVCFPECFLQGYFTDADSVERVAIDLESVEFSSILEGLRDLAPTLVMGLIERRGIALFNTAVVVERGALVCKYRKVNLLTCEREIFQAGTEYPVFDVRGVNVGINICYDLNFSEMVKNTARAGANAIICPSNNMLDRKAAEAWKYRHTEIRALRASEAGVWLVSADVTGECEDRISYGPTALIDPSGSVVDQVTLMQIGMIMGEI